MSEKINISKEQLQILRLLSERNGKWNWFQLSRAWLQYGDPSHLQLGELIKLGLLKEVKDESGGLPKLLVTDIALVLLH